jgi:hypothetical protein
MINRQGKKQVWKSSFAQQLGPPIRRGQDADTYPKKTDIVGEKQVVLPLNSTSIAGHPPEYAGGKWIWVLLPNQQHSGCAETNPGHSFLGALPAYLPGLFPHQAHTVN